MASTTFIVGDDETVTGDPLQVEVTIDDAGGVLTVTLDVVSGFTADLRGFFFNIDESLLSSLSVSGPSVVLEIDPNTNGIPEVDDAAPPNPEAEIGPLGPFFAGIEIGSPGIGGGDDFQSVTFTISSSAGPLTLADIVGQDIGIRAQSVGDNREGSSKLPGVVPPPEDDDASISGHKYHDVNGNGALDPGELGEPNWQIELYQDANGNGVVDGGDTLVATTTTGPDGSYEFTGLAAGDYVVVEQDIPGWVHITPNALAVTDLADGATDTGNDFYNALVGSISGHKYNDLNGNGSLDPGETGIGLWTIELYRDVNSDGELDGGDVLVQTTLTNPFDPFLGAYSFANVAPGDYLIVEQEQAGWTATSPVVIADVQLSAEHDVTGNDFFNRQDDDPPPPPPPEVDFDKDIDVNVDVSLSFDVDVTVSKSSDVDVQITSMPGVSGNMAELTLSVEAYGTDTYTQADVALLAIENQLSSIDLYAVSGIG